MSAIEIADLVAGTASGVARPATAISARDLRPVAQVGGVRQPPRAQSNGRQQITGPSPPETGTSNRTDRARRSASERSRRQAVPLLLTPQLLPLPLDRRK